VQVYEILFLILLGMIVSRKAKLPEGSRFRIFLGSYLGWRVVIDFLKPQPLIEGLNLIQWSCLAGIVLLVVDAVVSNSLTKVSQPQEFFDKGDDTKLVKKD
jgi:hypothetical protein